MSGVLNDCDALLQAANVRILNPDSAFINLTASAPGFHVTGAGAVDLATVTITADLIALDGDVVFTGQGVTLSNVKARSVDATYVSGTGIVTATVVTNGETFARSCVIPALRDGATGAAGASGAPGQPVYTWIKYADNVAGGGLSDDPAGKTYIGLAHNKSTATESITPGDYAWALIKGGDGVPGEKGADGVTYYTWIKYADQADGTGLYDVPNANTLYIGIAANRTTATESTTKTDYVWSRFKGEQGVAGAPTYTWIKYADSAAGAGMSDDPTGKAFIGLAYNKSSAMESATASDYAWSLIKGTDGQPGGQGADGATLYTWIKYSDVADGTGLYDTPTAGTLYIGIATNKNTPVESTAKTDYTWSKFRGDQGVQGPITYTWVKYADSAAGAGLSDDPTGKAYIGFAYNKTTATESTTATDYAWSLIKGTDGQPGGKGADGATLYTWIKYSDVADGTGLYDLPTANTQYLGIAVNKSTATESTDKTDYAWSKFRGADGVGTAGARGAGHYYATGSSWSDIVAQAACPNSSPVVNDVVTISSSTFVLEKRWTGSAWVNNGVVIDGKLIVPDSILTSALVAGAVTADKLLVGPVGSALSADPGFEDPSAWQMFTGANIVTLTDGKVGNKAMRSPVNGPGDAYGSKPVPCDASKVYRVRAWARNSPGSTGKLYIGVRCYDAAGNNVQGNGSFWYTGAVFSSVGTGWTEFVGTLNGPGDLTFTAACKRMAPIALLNYNGGTGYMEIQDLRVEEVLPGTLIQNGAITTPKLVAEAVTADKLAVNAVQARHIAVSNYGDNLVPDPHMKDPIWWGRPGVVYANVEGTDTPWRSFRHMRFGKAETGGDGVWQDTSTPFFPIERGAWYKVQFQVYLSGDFNGAITAAWHLPAEAWHLMGGPSRGYNWSDAEGGIPVMFDGNSAKGFYQYEATVYMTESNVRLTRSQFRIITKMYSGYAELGGFRVTRVADETLIGPGSVKTKHLAIAQGGDISSGQTSFDQGDGFWLEGVGNGHGARMSIGRSAGKKIVLDPQNNIFRLINPDLQLAARAVSMSHSPGTGFSHSRYANNAFCGSHTAYIADPVSPTYSWSLTNNSVQAQFTVQGVTQQQASVYVTPTGAAPGDSAYCTVTCTISDGGYTRSVSEDIYVEFS